MKFIMVYLGYEIFKDSDGFYHVGNKNKKSAVLTSMSSKSLGIVKAAIFFNNL
jgi:hypothetical protein